MPKRFCACLGLSLPTWSIGGATRKATAVTTACRNATVGLGNSQQQLRGCSGSDRVVAYALFSIVGTLGYALLFGQFSASKPAKAPAGS